MSLEDMRRPYHAEPLRDADFDADPVVQFQRWFAEAEASLVDAPDAYRHPNVCVLATADADGAPSVRFVLLKGADARGFVVFTDRRSRKGRELAANPRAALAFHWPHQERQVRIEGSVTATSREEDDRYFQARPRSSQLSAAASAQSEPIADRAALEAARAALAEERADASVPTPTWWGGFRIAPHTVEFWQGRPDRLHDRIAYTREGDAFRRTRLQP